MTGRRAGARASALAGFVLVPGVALALWQLGAQRATDPPHLVACILLGLWSLLVAMDERALGPLLFHQPLIAAGVAGWLVGQPIEGLLAGVMLQVIWPGLLPLGASRQPCAGLGALVWVLWLALLPEGGSLWRRPLAMGFGLLAAGWGMHAETWLRRRNARRAPGWRENLADQIGAGLIEAGCVGPIGIALFVLAPLLAFMGLERFAPAASGAMPDPRLLSLFAMGGYVGDRTLHSLGLWRRRQRTARPAAVAVERPAPPAAPRLALRRLWVLMTLQAAFSNEYLQRAGFLRLILTSPTRIRDEGAQAPELLAELMEGATANTQPVLAAAIAGSLDRIFLEAQQAQLPRSPVRLIEVGGAILAQWGDRVIWGTVRPHCAILTIALLPLAPRTVLTAYLTLGIAGGIAARLGLYRWGWRAGWDLVRGGSSWGWRRGPALMEAASVPVGLLTALALLFGYPSLLPAGGALAPWSRALVWFMVGVPCGACLARRPTIWGWACWLVGIVPG